MSRDALLAAAVEQRLIGDADATRIEADPAVAGNVLMSGLYRYRINLLEDWVSQTFSPWVQAQTAAGYRIWINLIDDLSRAAMRPSGYEPEISKLLIEHHKPGTTFMDVGANIGCHTLAVAHAMGKTGGRVFSFEAQTEIADNLAKSIADNAMDHVTLVRAVLSDRVESGFMVRDSVNLGGGRVANRAWNDQAEAITTTRFDDLDLDVGTVSVMKLDIEGSEPRFIAGAADFFARQRPVIVTELSDAHLRQVSESSAAEYAELLLGMGYALSKIDAWGNLTPLDFESLVEGVHMNVLAVPQDQAPNTLAEDAGTTADPPTGEPQRMLSIGRAEPDLRVAMQMSGEPAMYYEYLDDLREPLAERGIVLVTPETPHDLLFIDDTEMQRRWPEPTAVDEPTVVYERNDTAVAQIQLRQWIKQPSVLRWLKTSVCRVAEENNLATMSGNQHVDAMMRATGMELSEPQPPYILLEPEDLAKLAAFQPIWMMPRFAYLRRRSAQSTPIRPLAERYVDVFHAGHADYGWPAVTRHRRLAGHAALDLVGRNVVIGRGQSFLNNDYFQMVENSRIQLSPFGYGEMNWKDYEAILLKSVIVKPPTSYIETDLFDLYRPGYATVECADDFSDLAEVVTKVLDDLPGHQARVDQVHDDLLALCAPEVLADHFAKMVRGALA